MEGLARGEGERCTARGGEGEGCTGGRYTKGTRRRWTRARRGGISGIGPTTTALACTACVNYDHRSMLFLGEATVAHGDFGELGVEACRESSTSSES